MDISRRNISKDISITGSDEDYESYFRSKYQKQEKIASHFVTPFFVKLSRQHRDLGLSGLISHCLHKQCYSTQYNIIHAARPLLRQIDFMNKYRKSKISKKRSEIMPSAFLNNKIMVLAHFSIQTHTYIFFGNDDQLKKAAVKLSC